MHRFRTLTIYALDLSREHQLIHRTVASLFVTRLELHVCMTKSTAQLGRFITSFPSLLYLDLDSWLLSLSDLRGMGIRRGRSRSSIKNLTLRLVLDISGLLDYFIKARPFVDRLQGLVLKWEYTENVERNASYLRGIGELFQHCSQRLEWLIISVQNSEFNDIQANFKYLRK